MTTTVLTRPGLGERRVRSRRYLMCPPTHFDIRYAINPWMDPSAPVDRRLVGRQWWALVEAYRDAGHEVDLLEPVEGLPDMVYAANGALVVDGRVLGARFAHPERAAEAAAHAEWHRLHGSTYGGSTVQTAVAVNEAEGDFAVTRDRILAGWGFRTSRAAHAEVAALTGRTVLSLQLVDPRFYHLDVALTVLDDEVGHIAYYPSAFSAESRRALATLYPDALIANGADAYAFGLNGVSDGRNVFLPVGADHLGRALEAVGYVVRVIDLSELQRGGGSVKCCTQEIRPAPISSLDEQSPSTEQSTNQITDRGPR